MKVTQSCPTLCNPMVCVVHGTLQARILEWVAFPFSRGSSQPRDQTQVSHIAGRFFTSSTTWGTLKVKVKVSQSCLTLCNPMVCVVHGVLPDRIPEQVAFLFSRGSSNPGIKPRFPALQADYLAAEPQ